MNILIYPTYFPNILTFAAIAQAESVILEVHGNYQKQTLRNRTRIYGANGPLTLTVPVHYTQKQRQGYDSVKISYQEPWKDVHWKSIHSAYSNSPFFQYYDNYFESFFKQGFEQIMDLSIGSMELLAQCLDMNITWQRTAEFNRSNQETDLRYLSEPGHRPKAEFSTYMQVFKDKHGFIPNLSTLDLLFNEGPASLEYLRRLDLKGLIL